MKYVGSKARISKYIIPILQDMIDKNGIETYVEPFVGGGNLIEKISCKNRIGYDNNYYLIEFWKAIRFYSHAPRGTQPLHFVFFSVTVTKSAGTDLFSLLIIHF